MLTGLQKDKQTESPAALLTKKMMELGTALFFTENDSLLKLPTHVISETEVDEEEQIWFAIPRPAQQIEEFDKELPAKLDFFKKGKEFYIKVVGKAFIISDPAEIKNLTNISEEMRERMQNGKSVAVKVQIRNIECIETVPKPQQNWIQSSKLHLSSLFF